MKIKESEKRIKNLDIARELKKLWNMRVTVIPVVTGILGTIPKSRERGREELKTGKQIETIKTIAFLR